MKGMTAGRLYKSASARFLLLYLAISLACVVPILCYVYYKADDIVLEDFTGRLERRRENLVRHYQDGGLPLLSEKIRSRIDRGLIDDGMILLVDSAGRKVEGNLSVWPANVTDGPGWKPIFLKREGEKEAHLFLVSVTHLPSGHRFLISGRLDDREQVQSALLYALLGAFGLAVPLALIGSLIVVRQLNRMVEVVADTASHIADGDLGRRARRDHSLDPLDRLSASLNRMLRRIETLVEENRMMTDALAHDLRSPLTRICASLDKAGRFPAPSGNADQLQAIGQEVDLMLHMLDSTLEISRAEAGIGRGDFAWHDLGALVQDLYDMYQPLAEEQGLRLALDSQGEMPFLCNRGLIARALSNLIDNAIKYGGTGGLIHFGAHVTSQGAVLHVADAGSGIAPERRAEAIGKYRRLDDARGAPGMGLGLTLVAAVARLHNGELLLEDNAPGLRASLVLPRALPGGVMAKPRLRRPDALHRRRPAPDSTPN